MLSSLLAVIYIWRVIETAYFQSPPADRKNQGEVSEAPLSMLLPMWTLIAASVYFGVETSASLDVAARAAEFLLGAGR